MTPKWHAQRQWYADALAALVMHKPSLSPSREELPREEIMDSDLRCLLSEALLTQDGVKLTKRLWQSNRDYCCHLLKIAASDVRPVWCWYAGWYAERYLQMCRDERRAVELIREYKQLGRIDE